MPSSFTVESIHAALRALLAPEPADRKAADQLLFSLLNASGDEKNPQLSALIDAATTRFGAQQRDFLRDLTVWWMNGSALAYDNRMRHFSSARHELPRWEAPRHTPVFVQNGPLRLGEFELFGMGIGIYLEGQSERLDFLVPLIERGLRHPEPLVTDTCWSILCKLPAHASEVFPGMRDVAFKRGAFFAPDAPMRGFAAIVAAAPQHVAELADALRSDSPDSRVEAICSIAGYLPQVPGVLSAALRARFDRGGDADDRLALFRALTRIAQVSPSPATDDLLTCAESLIGADEPSLRAAAAWGLVRQGNIQVHEAALIALLRDADWLPRSEACAALAAWTPTPALSIAVADRLGDWDGPDGYPHREALATLTAWKHDAAPAVARIGRWLDQTDDFSEIHAEALYALLVSLGPAAGVLLPQVARFVAENWQSDTDADAGNDAMDADDENGADAETPDARFDLPALLDAMGVPEETAARRPVEELQGEFAAIFNDAGTSDTEVEPPDTDGLAQRLGIDLHEDIPGTRSSKELAEEPDTEALLRRWIAQMS